MKAVLYLHNYEWNVDMHNYEHDFNLICYELTEFEAGIWKGVLNGILVKGF